MVKKTTPMNKTVAKKPVKRAVSDDEAMFESPQPEEAEAVEIVEEEPSEEAPSKDPSPSKRVVKKAAPKGIGKAVIALIVVGILVGVTILAVSVYLVVPRPPEASFYMTDSDPNEVQAGRTVTFDASKSVSNQAQGDKVIDKYAWDFGDGTTGEGKIISHAFLKKGTYKVVLTVTDGAGKTASNSMQVTVIGMVVIVPQSKIGDVISYDMDFDMDFANPNGVWSYTEVSHPTPFTTVTMTAMVTQVHMELDRTKTIENTITTTKGQGEDGFNEAHSCVDRETKQQMSFTGYAIVKMIPKTGPTQTVNQTLTGDSGGDEHVCTDLNTNRTIKTVRVNDYSMRLGTGSSFAVSGTDTSTSYPKKREEFTIDHLRANRTFRTGDTGEFPLGPSSLIWDVAGEDNLKGYPTLKLHMVLDQDTMDKYGIDTFDITMWLYEGFSAPLKITMAMAGGDDGNTYSFNYASTFKSFTQGPTDIPFGTCAASTSDGHHYNRRPSIDYIAPDDYSPAMGSNSQSLATYPLPDAISYAKASSPGLRNYLDGHADAYLLDAYYNKTSGYPTWNLTFGIKNSTSAYNIIVTQSSVKSQGEVKVTEVTKSIKDYSAAMTFTGAEQVFQSRSDIKSKVYSGSQIDTSEFNFGVKADVPYSTSNSISVDNEADATEYYFYVKATDGSYSAGVDAGNGQLLFINTHTTN